MPLQIIMNTQPNRDSEFCGALPLHLINNIQPYGILLVLELQTFKIIQVSVNIEEAAGLSIEQIIGTDASALFDGDASLAELQSLLDGSVHVKLPYAFSLNGQPNMAVAHHTGPYLMLELEPIPTDAAAQRSFVQVFGGLKYAMANMEAANSIDELCSIALRELKKISGFDRIMIYQFESNWDGIVVAETLEEGMEPYLGLRFPASDVPRGARELYQKNPYRLIPNRAYEPVKLHPFINPATEGFIDLSFCNLRGVAGVHLEYLKNMGVTASMSIRILHEDRLWGLISCHHRTVHHPSVEVCSAMELLSNVFASRVSALERLKVYEFSTNLQGIQSSLMEQVYRLGDMNDALLTPENTISHLLDLDGAAILQGKKISTAGNTPTVTQISNIALWYDAKNLHGVFASAQMENDYEPAKEWEEKLPGVIIIAVRNGRHSIYIMGFRKERVSHVAWGGNPDDTIQFENDGKKYHPRASFGIWKQKMTGTSEPWQPSQLTIADTLRFNLHEYITKQEMQD